MQIKLFQDLSFYQRKDHFSGILPYAKSKGWWLVSHGVSYVDCGQVKALGCDRVGDHPERKVFIRYYKQNCRRKECPICFEGWASLEAERTLCRLVAFTCGKNEIDRILKIIGKETKGKNSSVFHEGFVQKLEDLLKHGYAGLHPIHVVLSPDSNTKFTKDYYKKTREKAYKIAKKAGLIGGSVVIHPYRLRCQKCEVAIPDFHDYCPECGEFNFGWIYSPHFHVVGFGWIHDTDKIYQKYGWVVKNLGVRKSVFWTMQYILSHSGIYVDPERINKPTTFHTITWFGELSYSKLSGISEIHVPPSLCPYCGGFLRPFEFVGLDRPPPDFDEENYANNEFLDDCDRWFALML